MNKMMKIGRNLKSTDSKPQQQSPQDGRQTAAFAQML
jgi:hypothetical protein